MYVFNLKIKLPVDILNVLVIIKQNVLYNCLLCKYVYTFS